MPRQPSGVASLPHSIVFANCKTFIVTQDAVTPLDFPLKYKDDHTW